MGRGGTVYLSYTAAVLLATASSASAGLWDISIDLSPAPPSQEGPPFSAHATRNRALLPYEIIGIVGAYVGTALVVTTLLLTVGRRLRKRAQTMAERPTELVKPMYKAFEPSPISPASFSRWGQKLKSKRSVTGSVRSARSGTSDVGSPVAGSLASFDPRVFDQDKERDNKRMEDLYRAVFESEEQSSQHHIIDSNVPQLSSPPQYSRAKPPQLKVSGPDLQQTQAAESYPASPYSHGMPRSSAVRAIYPPTTQNMQQHDINHTRDSSFGSNKTAESIASPASGKLRKGILRKSIKDIKISAPMQRLRDDDNSDGARTPLTPRVYANPGPPPELPTMRAKDSRNQPQTPDGTMSIEFPTAPYEEDDYIDEIRAVPQTYPQRGNSVKTGDRDAQAGAATTISPIKRSAANVNNPLPFRQNNYAQQRDAFPTSPAGNWNFHVPRSPGLRSPTMKSPSIRERVVEIGNNRLGAPFTGCATPYSPYMPYTPVTPITPHLETRAERKQRQREERATRGAITEEDQVADEKDIWASGY